MVEHFKTMVNDGANKKVEDEKESPEKTGGFTGLKARAKEKVAAA